VPQPQAPVQPSLPESLSNSIPCLPQRFHFFSGPSKQERVAILEPRNDFSSARHTHHPFIDFQT